MEIFYLPVSPYSHKVLMACYEKEVDFVPRPINPFEPEERAAYRAIFPFGKLPVLRDGATLLPESSFIVEYLDHLPGQRMIPEDAEQSHAVRLKDRMVDVYLNDAALTVFFQNLRSEENRDKIRLERALSFISTSYKTFDKELAENEAEYFYGDHFSLADASLLPALRVAYKFIPFDDYGNICAYYERHRQRDSFIKMEKEINEVHEKYFTSIKQIKFN